jgi:hypothetical protein
VICHWHTAGSANRSAALSKGGNVKIYEIKLRVRGDKGVWSVIYARDKSIEAAIENAIKKESKVTGLDLVCCFAAETDIELI